MPRGIAKKGFRMTNAKVARAGLVSDVSGNQLRLRPSQLPDYDIDESDDDIRLKLNERFDIVRGMTRDAIEGTVRGLILSGPAGVGKTHEVDSVLDEWDPDGEKYTSSKGYIRATGLFRLLYKHRNPGSVLVFDDADTIFFDETSLNFLKIACDTTERRSITYGAETIFTDDESGEVIPRRFTFNGTVIFITNLDFDMLIEKGNKLAPHLEALISRSMYIDLGMKTKRDYLIRIYMAVDEGLFEDMNMSSEEIDDVLQFIEENMSSLRELSLRMAIKLAKIRVGKSSAGHWTRVARITCCKGHD